MKKVKQILNYLKKQNLKISFAESVTGGGLAYELVKNPGASSILSQAFITYSNKSKIDLLKVKEETINKFSVVSKEVAEEMVSGLKDITNSDISISITGNAGPSLLPNTKSYYSYASILYKNEIKTLKITYKYSKRKRVLKYIINEVYSILFNLLFS